MLAEGVTEADICANHPRPSPEDVRIRGDRQVMHGSTPPRTVVSNMNRPMISATRGAVGGLVVALLALDGCSGSAARAVRPTAPTFANATGSATCKVEEGRNEPFIVDWPAEKRSDLEVAAKQRIPVVAYGCNSLRLLTECEVEGTYSFVGVTEKEEVIRLADSDEVRANLPFSGAALAGKLSADLQRGSTVDIAFAIIGKRVSAKARVERPSLRGECSGATHFVRSTTVGAFTMQVSTRGKIRAAADVFGFSASGDSASSRDAQSRDGDLTACRTSTSEATEPVSKCGAPLRLELRPIREAESASTAEPSVGKAAARESAFADVLPHACPTGLVADDAGKCARPTASAPHVCTPGNASDCEEQCKRGSSTSCALFARMLQLGRGTKQDLARALTLYDGACKAGAMPACGRLGELLVAAKHPDEGVTLMKRSCEGGWVDGCNLLGTYLTASGQAGKVDVFALFKRSCAGGAAEGCWSLGTLFQEGVGVRKNDADALGYFSLACDGGARLGCASYAKAIDEGRGTTSDPIKAASVLQSSCERGFSDSCSALGAMYFQGHGVSKDVAKGVSLLQRACDSEDRGSCFVLGQRFANGIGVTADSARASTLYERACEGGIDLACRAAIDLRGRGGRP
jgi:uncharacterized protein